MAFFDEDGSRDIQGNPEVSKNAVQSEGVETRATKKQAWKSAVVTLVALVINILLFVSQGYMIGILNLIFWVGIVFTIVLFIRERK